MTGMLRYNWYAIINGLLLFGLVESSSNVFIAFQTFKEVAFCSQKYL